MSNHQDKRHESARAGMARHRSLTPVPHQLHLLVQKIIDLESYIADAKSKNKHADRRRKLFEKSAS